MNMLANPPLVETIQARIANLEKIALNVMLVEFEPACQSEKFPEHAPGAHIDVWLPNGLVRQYSLVNPKNPKRYVIAVGLDANSRGGSAYVHESLRQGDVLTLSKPRNNFPLHDCDRPVALVAGGIGITPIWAMAQALEQLQQPWVLYYCARTPGHAAFLQDIAELAKQSAVGRLVRVFDQIEGGAPLNFTQLFQTHGAEWRFYCCGPTGLLEAFVATARAQEIPEDKFHIEHFAAASVDESNDFAFDVQLNNGTVHHIPAGKTILDVLIDAGEPVMYSCKEGTCGTCETRVVGGEVDHRDAILTSSEKEGNRSMMICVSRCKTDKLVLNI